MEEYKAEWPRGIPYCKCGVKPTEHLCPRDVEALKLQIDAVRWEREQYSKKLDDATLQYNALLNAIEAQRYMLERVHWGSGILRAIQETNDSSTDDMEPPKKCEECGADLTEKGLCSYLASIFKVKH